MVPKLDSLDLNILKELQNNGRYTITELAKRTDSSRPTVTNRLKRLLEEKLILINGGLNPEKFRFKMASVGLEIKNDESRQKAEKYLKYCPKVIGLFRTPEKANIHVYTWGEDDNTLNSIIESFRDFPDVEIIYTHYLGVPIHGNMPIPFIAKDEDTTLCALECEKCFRYLREWCLGCPKTEHYKNPLTK